MSTVDQVFVIILSSLLTILFIIYIATAVLIYKLVQQLKYVAEKAEDVVDSVESAAEVFKDTGGRMALFKLIRNIYKMTKGGRKK
ncbi:MAG: hypothetical protein ACXWLH_04245 [Candidatus Saccharimonadales bacterium]